MTTVTRTASSKTAFRYEADMVPLLQKALPRLAFRREPHSPVKVFTEVPSVRGVPDLAGVRFIQQNLRKRAKAGVRPLTTDVEVRTILALKDGSLEIAHLADRVNVSASYMKHATIPLLKERGWLSLDSNRVSRRPEALWPARRVVTVEAKLRDWQTALMQARRQRLSADAAYIALDAARITPVHRHLKEISENGIGVIQVARNTGVCKVLVRPKLEEPRGLPGKYLLAERCLEMMMRGTFSGQIYPVFGRHNSSTLG